MTTVWYGVLAFLATGYAVLDGFDLGVGALHLWIARDNQERRTVVSAIGPVWDGNEVWLVAFGGLLLLAFPRVYAAGFSGFYLPLIIVLWLLIGRGLALEWRKSVDDPLWRAAADAVFSVSSLLLAAVFGLALGNVVNGVPLNPQGYYQGLFEWMLNPYALLMGLLSLTLLIVHGANWLALKTSGPVQRRARRLASRLLLPLFALTVIVTVATFFVRPAMVANFRAIPPLGLVPLAALALFALLWRSRRRGDDGPAFLSSAGLIAVLIASTAIGLFPDLLPSEPDPARSLTVANAASAPHSLAVGLIWAILGLIVVLGYTGAVYYLFRGKVVLGKGSHY